MWSELKLMSSIHVTEMADLSPGGPHWPVVKPRSMLSHGGSQYLLGLRSVLADQTLVWREQAVAGQEFSPSLHLRKGPRQVTDPREKYNLQGLNVTKANKVLSVCYAYGKLFRNERKVFPLKRTRAADRINIDNDLER